MIADRNKIVTRVPDMPGIKPLVAYKTLKPVGQILLSRVIDDFKTKIYTSDLLTMENLPINHQSGQSFGYIVYRKTKLNLSVGAVLKISGYVADTVLVLLNGRLLSKAPKNISDVDGFGFWRLHNSTIKLTSIDLKNVTLDLVVENFGRSCQGRLIGKGLSSPVFIDDKKIVNWTIMPFELKKNWTNTLHDWKDIRVSDGVPAFYKFILKLTSEPKDTYVDTRGWNKGLVIVNGFVLSRYFLFGPQQSAYLPAPLLKVGENNIIVFEHYIASNELKFSNKPIWDIL